MHDTKERLSLLWIFAMFNYLCGCSCPVRYCWLAKSIRRLSRNGALLGSALLLEIPMAMIVACRLLRFRANRLAKIFAAGVETLAVVLLTFVAALATGARPPAFPEYVFFGTIEIVCTLVIMWQAWTWSGVEASS